MISPLTNTNELATKEAFDVQAPFFDTIYGHDLIIDYKRERVRNHINQFLKSSSHLLELNAGTGEDCTYFAGQGHSVHATDLSADMLHQLESKVREKGLTSRVSAEQCSFTELGNLQNKGPYDWIFSNFAGLNCTDRLDKVLASLPGLLKPGAGVTLVILPRFCLWEFLFLLKGRFKTAFRRFAGKKGAPARIEAKSFRCWYYNPSYVLKHMRHEFDCIGLEGLCTLVPPSYVEGFGSKYPRLFKWLKKKENRWASRWPWRSIGDYYVISFRKKN
jgi:ubiquinone/menaquinone biosynthesis C-methylase UbiE